MCGGPVATNYTDVGRVIMVVAMVLLDRPMCHHIDTGSHNDRAYLHVYRLCGLCGTDLIAMRVTAVTMLLCNYRLLLRLCLYRL